MKITIVADISSRISQKNYNADRITAAAVCLPSGELNNIRKLLHSDLPKWRDASDSEVRLVSDIVVREALGIGVFSIGKSDEKWDQFWEDGESANSDLLGKASAVKAAFQIKCQMFVTSTSYAFISAVNAENILGSSNRPYKIATNETLIFDKEIDGDYNIDVFNGIWRRMNERKQDTELHGVRRNIDEVLFTTEQEDRLLMLPDYVAGIAQAALSQANVLARSQVTAQCVQSVQQRLKQAPHYILKSEQFSLTHSDIFGALF
ncbi:hypothetical protein [Massilia arenae]|uniref:DUF3800 domain-containing protein n=1 Tax=Massilia arenae TaxID=2603288 RepID=A0A5C7G572_9BURK|nr:hypothetical protein [Massilia arenae]TXF99207.1 hypothetical protein FVD38_13525 [Massilia arenae]